MAASPPFSGCESVFLQYVQLFFVEEFSEKVNLTSHQKKKVTGRF